jgi:hypothetical protein
MKIHGDTPRRLAFTLLAATGFMFAATTATGPDLSPTGKLAKQKVDAINAGLTIQASPCLNQPDCGEETGPASTQAETTIAVDSTGQHVVVGFNDFRGFANANFSISGFMYSDDGGVTFIDGGQLPTGPTTVIGGQRFPQVFGDPDVKYLGGCNFVYSSIMLKGFSATTVVQTMSVHRSTDCGHSWSGPFEATAATNPNGRLDVNGAPEDAADKELGDVDPDTGRYMMCWSNFTPVAAGGIEMSCTFSDDILTATPPTFSARRVVAATLPDGQAASVRFAGNGSPNVYIGWSRFTGAYTNNVGFARSTDNGVTWSTPINLSSNFITMDQVLGNDRVHNFPTVAVDNSTGPFRGSIYVVYANNNSLDGADVAFQRSLDRGVTFSAPIFLNARPGSDRAQWFPYVTVDSSSGRVWVFYYDQSVATSGDLTEVTYIYSDNGGTSWSKPVPLTQRPFKAGWGNDTSAPNLGDYNQAVAQSGSLYGVYAGTVLAGFADGQPSTSMTTPDVVFAKVASGTVKPPLHTGTVTFAESGGEGNIDPGDQVHLKIPLINYDTNPLHAGTVSAIFATLFTSTPGVTITQSSSAYPDLAAGASNLNTTDFILQLSPGFAPGTPIELALAVSSGLGSTTLLLTQATGTPVYTTLLNETFDGVVPGVLPAGWIAAHGAGVNTVPWTTSSSFAPTLCGTSNKAFHINANDGPAGGDQARWERLLSPIVTIPAEAQYVTLDFDVCYDTENDTILRTLGYDGFFLRITDQTPGRTLRSVLAEAFDDEFTTGGLQHYPSHFPRNDDGSYFEDMSAWSGFSNGPQHVHMKFPGMAGSRVQLRFEFAQDQVAICSDVRPGHACGVTVDNIVMRSVVSIQPLSVTLVVTQSLSRDPVTSEIVAGITVTNTGTRTASNVEFTSVLLGSMAPATTLPNLGNIAAGGSGTANVRFPGTAGASGSPSVLRVAGSYTGGNFASSSRVILP